LLFRCFVPKPPLREFVDNFWLYQGYAAPHAKERIPPSGTFKLVFNLHEDELRIYDPWQPHRHRRFSGALLSLPCGEPFVTDSAEERFIVGVNFKLGGAFPFFGRATSAAGETHIDLRELWGSGAAELQDRLAAVATPRERFELLERALLARFSTQARHHAVVLAALETLGRPRAGTRTRELARDLGVSERRFIELFKADLGVRPKTFSRVRRCQHAMALMRQAPSMDLASIAASCRYFDQSHMNLDFVAFCGLAPAAYRRRQRELSAGGVRPKPNHIPLPD
jgi:AraC-like DNA-binding protein